MSQVIIKERFCTYPDRTVRLNVASVDIGNNLSPSCRMVYSSFGTNGDTTTDNHNLGPRQEAQQIRTVCGTVEYQIYGPEMDSPNLILSTNLGSFLTAIEVEMLPCKPCHILLSMTVHHSLHYMEWSVMHQIIL